MSRLLLPLTLSAAAFAAAWWAGSVFPAASPTAPPGEAGADSSKNPHADPASLPVPDAASSPAEASKMPPGFARREAVLRSMEITDIGAIRRLFETSRPEGDIVFRLTRIWAEQDPAGLWKWLEGGGKKSFESLDVTNIVFDAWLRKDAAAALAAFRAADSTTRRQAASGLLYGITSTDEKLRSQLLPYLDEIVAADSSGIGMTGKEAETIALLGKLPPGTGRDTLLQSTARNWMESDWKAASAWASGQTEPLKSKVMAEIITKALNPTSRRYYSGPDQKPGSHAEPECFEWAKQWFTTEAPADLRRKMGPQFVNTLAEKDPAAALEWAQDHLGARPLTQAIGKVVEQQAKKDPAAARTLVEELPPGGVKQHAAFAIVSNPTAESVTWLIGQADKSAVSEWYQVAANWSFKDPAAYKKYLETAAPDSLPASLVNGGITNLIRKDAPGTLDWVLSTQTPKTAGTALENWSWMDTPAAAAWLKDHAAADWSKGSLNSLAGRYFERSPTEAADWASSLPPGPVRDTTLASLRKSLAGKTSLKAEQRTALEERLGKP